ncbi:hypothetical protein ACTWP5_26405 [Streptomyces sp. 4N509B]|uniref:hypothetical protein n=1 Tax=Streptomyces sp. 4N509B TaxID=3457413 RepID=UPI003FD4017C
MNLRWPLITAILALTTALAIVLATVPDDGSDGDAGGETTGAVGEDEAAESPPTDDAAPAGPEDVPELDAADRISEPRPGEQARYVGISDDGAFAVVIIVWGDEVVAYAGDGARREAWLNGAPAGDTLALTGADGAFLDASVAGGEVTGIAAQGDWQIGFTLPLAEAPAGVYRAGGEIGREDVGYSLVVLPDGTQAGIAWTDGEPEPAPAFDLMTGELSDRGESFTVDPVGRGQL